MKQRLVVLCSKFKCRKRILWAKHKNKVSTNSCFSAVSRVTINKTRVVLIGTCPQKEQAFVWSPTERRTCWTSPTQFANQNKLSCTWKSSILQNLSGESVLNCLRRHGVILCKVGTCNQGKRKEEDSKAPNETNEAWRGERRLAGRRNEGEVR